jgi:hypothetical protein
VLASLRVLGASNCVLARPALHGLYGSPRCGRARGLKARGVIDILTPSWPPVKQADLRCTTTLVVAAAN